ncbi:MAG: DUF1566 domain-containing protein [Anaeromyxobacter sp.]|nr:DUF1566 domain-containing protein [Anaeromyxobacter sp.]
MPPPSDRRTALLPLLAALAFAALAGCAGAGSRSSSGGSTPSTPRAFLVVDTGQVKTFDALGEIAPPVAEQAFYGQDAQFTGSRPRYSRSADGLTVLDDVTGLTWQKSPDTNGDGTIDSLDKMTLAEARARPAVLNAARYGGYDDWRLPTIKELYSLMDFAGADPSGATGNDTSGLTPFIDRASFDFGYGDTARGERIIDMQYASSTVYVSTTMLGSPTMFGVNFADGRIKGYTLDMSYQGPGDAKFPVRLVRGAAYGENDLADNGDGTISDRAGGLTWTKGDSAAGMTWPEALAWVQARNADNHLGHSDWRLPNAKELQSIVDYTRSPDTTSSAAISPLFTSTGITNEAGKADYPYYWTSTTHESQAGGPGGVIGGAAVYIAFGRAMGYMTAPWDPTLGAWLDVHGAGAQRSDPKEGDPADFPQGRGPQGDAIRIYNFVRMVRGGSSYPLVDTRQSACYDTSAPITCPAPGGAFYGQDAQSAGAQPSHTRSGDGLTVHDAVTGLTWQQGYTSRVGWTAAMAVPATLNAARFGGYSDWRLPTIKELYSIWDASQGWPYLDTTFFAHDPAAVPHGILWSSTRFTGLLESTTDPTVGAAMAFGVNFDTGHIKAYAMEVGPTHGVRCVRGDRYGVNDLQDHGDGTITDQATGLMWAQADSGAGMDWENALAYAQAMNAASYLGHADWRLPSTKELQSIVDYGRSPGATDPARIGPAIDPLFSATPITNEAGDADYPWYWTGTSAKAQASEPYTSAWYVAFGRAVGSDGRDLHGAGAVRFDAKVAGAPGGEGRYFNFVRLVRSAR